MPHYKDGTEAKVGDIVRGRGYNVKHEIIGKLVHVKPGEAVCNVTIACVTADTAIGEFHAAPGVSPMFYVGPFVIARLEYGQADAFEKLA